MLPFIGEEVARKQKIHAVVFTISRAKRALDPRGLKGVYHPGPDLGFVGIGEGRAKLALTRLDATGCGGPHQHAGSRHALRSDLLLRRLLLAAARCVGACAAGPRSR